MWRLGALAILLSAAGPAAALPVLGASTEVDGVAIYPDDRDRTRFYYPPGKLAIARDADGRPEIRFLQMRYAGTSATGDRGEFRTRSILTFRVRLESLSGNRLAAVKAKLAQRAFVRDLRPLPIQRVEAVLNYLPLAGGSDTARPDEKPREAGKGALESAEGTAPAEGYWSERVFTLAPDDATSQALWEAFRTGRVILSLSYAFHSAGIPAQEIQPRMPGQPPSGGQPARGTDGKTHVVAADTVSVTVDASRLPECLKRIDINEQVPPGYAVLSVYCYDFNNELRPDLEERAVEVQATSVSGKPLNRTVRFSRGTPDIYSVSARFPFAVALKRGYRYRIREVTLEGVESVGPWRDGKAWTQILDITTPPEERPPRPETPDGGDKG